jgi:hypothetical protein
MQPSASAQDRSLRAVLEAAAAAAAATPPSKDPTPNTLQNASKALNRALERSEESHARGASTFDPFASDPDSPDRARLSRSLERRRQPAQLDPLRASLDPAALRCGRYGWPEALTPLPSLSPPAGARGGSGPPPAASLRAPVPWRPPTWLAARGSPLRLSGSYGSAIPSRSPSLSISPFPWTGERGPAASDPNLVTQSEARRIAAAEGIPEDVFLRHWDELAEPGGRMISREALGLEPLAVPGARWRPPPAHIWDEK